MDTAKEIVDIAKKALEAIDNDMKDRAAIDLDTKAYVSYAGALDSIILLGEDIIKKSTC